jgi:hypothetical protein
MELAKDLRASWKSVIVITLTASAVGATFYYHAVLKTGVIFSHFFYIPIVIASVWWMRKGVLVASLLSVTLILSRSLQSSKRRGPAIFSGHSGSERY